MKIHAIVGVFVFSNTCHYGLRAALYIASAQDGRQFIPVREIAEALDLSFYFLAKIVQLLTRRDLLVSFKGPNGGVALARPAQEITLLEVIRTIEGYDPLSGCVLGLERCSDENPCPLHASWTAIRNRMDSFFGGTSLADLAGGIRDHLVRLSDEQLTHPPAQDLDSGALSDGEDYLL